MENIGQVKVAAAQMDPKLGKLDANLDKVVSMIDRAAANDVKLVVFPECALTGYMFTSAEEADMVVETIPGPSSDRIVAIAKKNHIYVVYGTLEKSMSKIHNVAVLVGPEGIIGRYRKIQPPHMGSDHFCEMGADAPRVFKTPIGNLGIMICMDTVFPEHARALALAGVDVLIVPTNTPAGTDRAAKVVQPTRALENHCFMIYSNRFGTEAGDRGTFMGMSMIIDVWGEIIAEASMTAVDGTMLAEEELVYAVIEPEQARNKRIEGPGWWCDLWEARRPELYGEICQPKRGY
jgi:predicted amidohydrolase